MVAESKLLLLFLFNIGAISGLTTKSNGDVTLSEHPFTKFCHNYTCPNRYTCTIGIKNRKIPIYEEKCTCICSNIDACNPRNINSTKCFCDGKIYGDVCSVDTPTKQFQCERSDWTNYCQPQCDKPYTEQLLCCNMKQDPWESCDEAEKCINNYNNGFCDQKCNNNGCLFDGDDCYITRTCLTCDPASNNAKEPHCIELCKTIKHHLNQTINRQLKSNTYLEIEFQSSYGLAYVSIVSILEQLSLKFSVIFNVAIGADMKPVMYSKYSKNFSRITTTILFTLDPNKCLSKSCVIDPYQIANNLIASSYLEKDTLTFKVVNANGYALLDRSGYFSFENGYFLLVFVVATVLTASIFVGSMYYTHQNSYWPNGLTSSSNSNISSQSSLILHTENETTLHEKNQYIPCAKPTFSNWKSDSHMLAVTPEDIKENLAITPNLYLTMTPTNFDGDVNPVQAINGIMPNDNFSQPMVSGSSLLLVNNRFGNWSSLVRYSKRQLSYALPYRAIIPTINGVLKAVVTTMDSNLYANIRSKLFRMQSNESAPNNISNDMISRNNVDYSKYTGSSVHTNTVIHDCIKNGIFLNNEELLNANIPFLELKNEQSFHPILLSVMYSRTDWLDYFCNHGVSLDSHDNNGWRSVHWAVATNNIDVIKVLRQYRANFEVTTNAGETSLMIACRESSLEAILVLLHMKVSLVQMNHSNKDCVDIAIENNRLAVLNSILNMKQKIDRFLSNNPQYLSKVAKKLSILGKHPTTTLPLQRNENLPNMDTNINFNQSLKQQFCLSQIKNSQQLYPSLPVTSGALNSSFSHSLNSAFSQPIQNPNVAFTNGKNMNCYNEDSHHIPFDIRKRVYCPLQSNTTVANQSVTMCNTLFPTSNLNFKMGKYSQNQPNQGSFSANSNCIPNFNVFTNDTNYLLSTPSVDNFLNMVQAHMMNFSTQNNFNYSFVREKQNVNNMENQIYMSQSSSFNSNNTFKFENPTNPLDPYLNSNR